MNRSNAVVLISSFVVLGACAHNNAVTTPVAVTVSSQNAGRGFVRDVRNAALTDISQTVPGARPMTVTADLDVTTETLAAGRFNNYDFGTSQHAVPAVSSNPNNEPSTPTVQDNRGVFFPSTMIVVTEVNVAYTIKDAGGKIIESDHVRFSVGSPGTYAGDDFKLRQSGGYSPSMTIFEPFPNDRMMVRDAAAFLASRVKALTH